MFSCNFVQYATDTANDDTMAIGLLWRSVPYNWEVDDYQYTVGGCTPYNWFGQSKIDIDGMFKAARGFGLVRDIVFFFNLGCFIPSLTVVCLIFQAAVTFGCAMSSVVWIIAPCIPVRKIGWTIIGLILAVIGLFQILTLLILSSDTCSFKTIPYLLISNTGWSSQLVLFTLSRDEWQVQSSSQWKEIKPRRCALVYTMYLYYSP